MLKINFRFIVVSLTVLTGVLAFFSIYKLVQFQVFPWLNVFILSGLSFLSLLLSLLVKNINKWLKFSLMLFFIIQFSINYLLLNDAKFLKYNWKWLFYLLVFEVFILLIALIQRKQKSMKLILFLLLSIQLVAFIGSIFYVNAFFEQVSFIIFIVFTSIFLLTKNSKSKSIEKDLKTS